MTDNEPDVQMGSPSRRSSVAAGSTEPERTSTEPAAAAPTSQRPASESAPAPASTAPVKRALPPPPTLPSQRPAGTQRRTSYTIPAATAPPAAAAASSAPAPAKPLEVQYHVSAKSPRSTYTSTGPTTVEVLPVGSPPPADAPPPAESYRSPEAVVEHVEDAWTSSLPPGVLAVNEDDGRWSAGLIKPGAGDDAGVNNAMDVDTPDLGAYSTPERPQIGPGVMARAWLDKVHHHPLFRPVISEVPRPAAPTGKTPPARQASLASDAGGSAPAEDHGETHEPLTVDDVLEALPGGKAQFGEWYFCPSCWGWFHVVKGSHLDPNIPMTDEWVRTLPFDDKERVNAARNEREREMSKYRDLTAARGVSEHKDLHFHPFNYLVPSSEVSRIERVNVEGHVDKYFHLELEEQPERFLTYASRTQNPTLWTSCTSDHWVFVDQGPMPGQLSPGLVKEFGDERNRSPPPGQTPAESTMNAWSLVITLLQNPLFKRKRGWVKLSNATFQNKIGATLLSSHLMHQIGFACTEQEGEGYRVGPFNVNDKISEEDVKQMDRYMARVLVEVCLALHPFQLQNKLPVSNEFVGAVSLEDELKEWLNISSIPNLSIKFETKPFAPYLETLGVKEDDVVDTVSTAYDLQISDDYQNLPKYLSALEKLSNAHVPGVETLQIKVATDRSLERYTLEELDAAYDRIGVTQQYVTDVLVDREDIPNEVILEMHRKAMDATSNSTARAEISRALTMIGKDRNDPVMIQFGRNGGVYLSLTQAYKEFNTTRESGVDDDLLIMQYETWIQDRPSRADHYRTALSIIANAPGEERPVLQAYLQGKDVSEFQPPARRDIPAGLRNIGNTCYLNSVLQFLYAIKPVRDTVMAFEQSAPAVPSVDETEKEMEKRVKVESSRRFVGLLRELFEQMYTTSSKAVVPKEELARLAILPVDLVGERKDSVPVAPKSRVTIDSLPTVLSPDVSSGAATAADSPATSPPSTSPPGSPDARTRSILGKRASHDRESAFGGSEERLRRLTSSEEEEDLINFDSGPASPAPERSSSDVDMNTPAREGSELPNTGLSQLGITSPVTETGSISAEADGPTGRDESATEPASSQQPTPGPIGPMAPPPLPPRREEHQRRQSVALVAAEKFGLQQDAAEILINVLAQLEHAFEAPSTEGDKPSPNFISTLFSSKFRQQMILQSSDGSSADSQEPVESVFVHPIIGVEEDGKDLYDCLGELYLGGAEIEYEGKKGFKMDLIDELPPLLYIQMRRSQYDYAKRTQTKTNTHIAFDRTLVMDRFLAGADREKRETSIALTRKLMAMRARCHELKNHKPMSIPETFRFVADALSAEATVSALGLSRESSADLAGMADDLSPDILAALALQATRTEQEIEDLEKAVHAYKARIEELWAGQNEVEYELVSVFVHGGTGTGGHYWTYQANLPTDGNKFFYYSDETVKEVGADEVFADKSSKGIAPALLCYVRKDRDLVDTLHREAAPLETLGEESAQASSGEWTPYAGSAHGPIALS